MLHVFLCNLYAGKKNNDKKHPDYIPSVFPHKPANNKEIRRLQLHESQSAKRVKVTFEPCESEENLAQSASATGVEPLLSKLDRLEY